jgi:hypothetical protein
MSVIPFRQSSSCLCSIHSIELVVPSLCLFGRAHRAFASFIRQSSSCLRFVHSTELVVPLLHSFDRAHRAFALFIRQSSSCLRFVRSTELIVPSLRSFDISLLSLACPFRPFLLIRPNFYQGMKLALLFDISSPSSTLALTSQDKYSLFKLCAYHQYVAATILLLLSYLITSHLSLHPLCS